MSEQHEMDEAIRDSVSTTQVLLEICRERRRQDEKWGVQNHDAHKWNTILMEEVGEVAREAFEKDQTNRRAELIQVAAVAVAAIECLDRNSCL